MWGLLAPAHVCGALHLETHKALKATGAHEENVLHVSVPMISGSLFARVPRKVLTLSLKHGKIRDLRLSLFSVANICISENLV